MTAVTTVLVVALIVIPTLVRSSSAPTVVGLIGPSAQAIGPALQATAKVADVKIRVVDIADDDAARSMVKNGSVDVAVSIGAHSAVAEVQQTLSPTIGALLQATIDRAHQRQALTDAGVPLSKILAALEPVPLSTAALEPPPVNQAARSVAALAAGLLLYISLGLYGGAVASGVAQEKTSRTAEVLLAAVRPRQLLSGKVLGIGVCALAQLGIAVVAGLIANAVVKGAVISSTVWVLLPSILLWFLLGFALYSFAFAAVGSMVARQEEVQFVSLPVAMPLVGGFLLVYLTIAEPSAWWIRLLSFVPPFAPALMPARIALGHVSAWEIVLDVLLMAASIYGMERLAARVYSAAIVRGGARLGWRTALRLRGE
jgi:ABC-2 type transport system permease protein